MKEHPRFTFANLVDVIINAKGVKVSELCGQTGYNKTTIHNIRYKGHIPEKKTVITLGIALGLNLEQMEVFLFKAGYVFCPSIENDVKYMSVIMKFGSGNSRIIDCNIELDNLGLKDSELLGNFKK